MSNRPPPPVVTQPDPSIKLGGIEGPAFVLYMLLVLAFAAVALYGVWTIGQAPADEPTCPDGWELFYNANREPVCLQGVPAQP
jgi:hypothetical protein